MTEPPRSRATDLFERALERPPEARTAWLAQACPDDSTLHDEVVRMIDAHEASGAAEQSSSRGTRSHLTDETTAKTTGGHVSGSGSNLVNSPSEETISQQMGPYKILEPLGEGGMGEVYLAEQTEPVRRKVAIKVIKLGMDTKMVLARFDAERQALALMDHPSIAKVLDAGTTGGGRPYFVMEYVRGLPLTEYCDLHKLSTDERLELFILLCQAIQHAHQKAVIHRDLKPSNVLVTVPNGHPVPKVIDFGIAKAMGHRLTELTLHTEQGQGIGTPAYMSPEQAEMSGLDVDTRTDVYSLGVMLYELLVGARPLEPWQVAVALRESEPPTPSARFSTLGDQQKWIAAHRRTSPGSLRTALRGDLDWIVMRAMEKDRTRRYETVSGLALDIRRHLNHEPVWAGSPSAFYRLRKFVRRHRLGVTAGAAVAIGLLGGYRARDDGHGAGPEG